MPSLVEAFTRRHSGDRPRRFSRDAISRLQTQTWRGNARELENVIERTLALSDADLLSAQDLPIFGAGNDEMGFPTASNAVADGGLERALDDAARHGLTLRQVEDLYIEKMLLVTGGKKGEAARLLGIDRKTLYRRDPTSNQ